MTETPRNPKADQAAAKAYAKASRPWFKKKRIVIPGVLVVLAIIGGIGGGGGSDDDKSAAAVATEKVEKAADESPDEADAEKGDADAEAAAADLNKKVKAEAKKAADAAKAKKAAAAKAKAKKEQAKTVKVTVDQILKDYEENELSADTKYEGKMIEVTGTIAKIDKEIFGSDYVLNISNGDEYAFLTVNCNDMSKKALSKLTVGDDVTAIGKFEDGGDLGVELKKCSVA